MEHFSDDDRDAEQPRVPRIERLGQRASRDRAIAALAGQQWGAVSRAQLLGLGLSDDVIAEKGMRGHLHRIGPGVYAVGHRSISRRGRAMAALLQCGPASAISHSSAARIWEMVSSSTAGPVHVSTRDRVDRVRPDGVIIHRPRTLTAADIVAHRGLRVTTPERTLIDQLSHSSVADITRMLEQMITRIDRSPDALLTWATALNGRSGKGKLLRALDEVAGPAVIRSEFESRFRSVCQEAGVPAARTNYRIGQWEVDAAWVDQGVAVELDSWRFHGGKWQFHRDRRKGLAISRAGFELLRITWPQLKHETDVVVDAVRHAVARGAWRTAYQRTMPAGAPSQPWMSAADGRNVS